ncbi:MAG: hypothetical protein U1D67_09270, partial [Dehalococcoidia bacterium]|nr:hypothetical protein [Dehalococcoidia bacterium]
IDYKDFLRLNESSIKAGRRQNLAANQIPADTGKPFIVNFNFDHECNGIPDKRLSVIVKPGAHGIWLDISPEEFDSLPELEMSEMEWEAAVCVGIPPWTP